MNKLVRVLWNEMLVTVRRRSFLITTLGVPLVSFAVLALVGRLNRQAPDVITALTTGQAQTMAEGFVDPGGLIEVVPAGLPAGSLLEYGSEAEAQSALEGGKISRYYVLPADLKTSGQLTVVRPDFNPLSAFDGADTMIWLIEVNLLGGDTLLADRLRRPVVPEVISLSPETSRDENDPLTFWVPYAITLIFYTVILMSASFLLSSVTTEKENRVLEILMISVTPQELMVGKILGLGILGLLQTLLWAGSGYLLLRIVQGSPALPAQIALPGALLSWGILYFLLGYGVYASLMAGLGALVSSMREASQATFLVIFPLIVPLVFISLLIEDPHGALSVALSIFPLTGPVAMMTRLTAGEVPAWQLALSVMLLAATCWMILRSVSRLFRAQTLLSGQPFSLRRFLTTFAGRI